MSVASGFFFLFFNAKSKECIVGTGAGLLHTIIIALQVAMITYFDL